MNRNGAHLADAVWPSTAKRGKLRADGCSEMLRGSSIVIATLAISMRRRRGRAGGCGRGRNEARISAHCAMVRRRAATAPGRD